MEIAKKVDITSIASNPAAFRVAAGTAVWAAQAVVPTIAGVPVWFIIPTDIKLANRTQST